MKLRNKKTGEMFELKSTVNGDLAITKDEKIIAVFSFLVDINEEWDLEEKNEF